MQNTRSFKRIIALLMAMMMIMSMVPTAFAAEAESAELVQEPVISEEEIIVSEEETTDSEKQTIVSEEQTSGYSVAVSDKISNGTVNVDKNNAEEGDTVTVTAVAADGYATVQIGYWTVDADGNEGSVVIVEADENGVYSFVMPASDVKIGAVFQDGLTMTGNKIGGTSKTDYTLYMANGESFVKVGDSAASAYLTIDKRFFEIDDITMTLEIRQYDTGGYTVVGTKTYTYDELQALKGEGALSGDSYIFESIDIPVTEGKSFNEGWAQYSVVKFSRPCWTDVKGAASYRWTYTGDATVLSAQDEEPAPIVWLYNLDENSHRGALIRNILEDLNIPAGTVNNENLNQNIGYLVNWKDYSPVNDPYSSESYDVEYILMGNLTEVQLDDFIDAMQENNIRVNLKSIPTAWTASKTFAELFDIMAEEDEVLKAAIALDQMIYAAEELDETTYGSNQHWAEFKTALEEAIVALSTDAEESELGANLYLNARDRLQEMYLKVTGKAMLSGDLELICEEQEDGIYKVSAKLNSELSGQEFTYNWKPAGSATEAAADHIIVSADELYKVNLEITGTGNSYGELSAKLAVPGTPSFKVTTYAGDIAVELEAAEEELNTPAVDGYAIELYLNGEKVASQESTSAGIVIFEDLEAGAEYVIKVHAYNIVGRSDIVEEAVTVSAEGSEITPPADEDQDAPENGDADVPADEEAEMPEEDSDATVEDTDEKADGSEEKFSEDEAVATGDNSSTAVPFVLAVLALAAMAVAALKRKENN